MFKYYPYCVNKKSIQILFYSYSTVIILTTNFCQLLSVQGYNSLNTYSGFHANFKLTAEIFKNYMKKTI